MNELGPMECMHMVDKFEPNYVSLDVFGVWMDRTLYHLALAFLDRMEPQGVASAVEMLKAANALRQLSGGVPTKPTDGCSHWNEHHKPGTAIVVEYPESPSFIAVTTSVAFDTPCGPHVMIADSYDAVPLSAVKLYAGNAVGVLS